ncbi:MAG: hypothetical protein PHC33_03270 [Candidatus Omnitrophica bacterium]|nr:hypothetical protein [Candidatus Omnitrophota bacterium]
MKNKQRKRLSKRRLYEYCEVVITEEGKLEILAITPSTSVLFLEGMNPISGLEGNKIYCG